MQYDDQNSSVINVLSAHKSRTPVHDVQSSIRSLRLRSITPQVVHPNAHIPGNWWEGGGNKDLFKQLPERLTLNQPPTDDASSEEFFDPCDQPKPFQPSKQPSPLRQRNASFVSDPLTSASMFDFDPTIMAHMTEPLLPDSAPLDFSPIASMRWDTNVFSATPLARVREFNSSIDTNECSLMNILADEIESMSVADVERKPTLWETLRRHTIGLSEDEYDDFYPWAKYSCGEDQTVGDFEN